MKEAVQYERRVDYFKGAKLVDALLSPKNKLKEAPVKSRAEAAKLAQDLLKASYFHRSQRVTHAHSRRWELELLNGPFEEDGLYTWLYEGSKTKLYLMTIGMLVGALGLCMIQIWPLWLKIGVWWCSVTFLTTFGILCVVRLVLFCLMFIVGFRGIWLFPNLFDDNQTFAGSFMPIFGRGDPVVVDEDSDEEYWEHQRKKAKKKEESGDGKSPDGKSEKKPSSTDGGETKRRRRRRTARLPVRADQHPPHLRRRRDRLPQARLLRRRERPRLCGEARRPRVLLQDVGAAGDAEQDRRRQARARPLRRPRPVAGADGGIACGRGLG